MQLQGKTPPQARELEAAILGAIMIEKSAYDKVSDILQPEMFYVNAHQVIYNSFTQLAKRNMPIDLLTVCEQLKVNGELEEVGGPYAITKLTSSVVSSANIIPHSRVVKNKFIQRELIRISSEICADSFEDYEDVDELVNRAEKSILSISAAHITGEYTSLQEAAPAVLQRIYELRELDRHITGVPSKYSQLDAITHGWQKTDLIIIAARPSVGKTVFGLNLAVNAAELAKDYGTGNVGFFSLEMSTRQLVERILANRTGIPLDAIQTGRVYDTPMERLNKTVAQEINGIKIYIDDTSGINIYQLRSKARRMVQKDNVGMIVIDYLQLMSGIGGNRNQNREQEISQISRDLKGLAKELNVPVIALAQLSREVEKQTNGIPQLSHLRESGAIEQDADIVCFLYKPTEEAILSDANMASVRYCKVAKHRNGQLGTIEFTANNSIMRWSEFA